MLFPRLLAVILGTFSLCGHATTYQLAYVAPSDIGEWTGLNRHGAVSGATEVEPYKSRANIYENGSIRLLKAVGDGNHGAAINDHGDVAGQCQKDHRARACIWKADGTVQVLKGQDGSAGYLTVAGINNARQVATTLMDDVAQHAYLYDHGKTRDLGSFDGRMAEATGINKAGHVSGFSPRPNRVIHAFIHDGTQLKDLGTLAGHSFAEALNDNDVAVGRADVSDRARHAVMFKDGQIIDLGTLGGDDSEARGINIHEVVVGSSGGTAFVYRHGRMFNLNAELDPVTGAGWRLISGEHINDRGQIVALATRGSDFEVVLLTPMAEPLPARACRPLTGTRQR